VEELGELLGCGLGAASEGELLDAARSLCGRVGTVLLTRGRQGALAVSRGEAFAGAVEIGATRNTVGCGDAFLAGYLAALWQDAPVEDRLRQAVACGAASALADRAGQMDPGLAHQLAARACVRRV
jgi:fructose-1-phosphate kinase PfkB-like protein